jgi:hypothetical protein
MPYLMDRVGPLRFVRVSAFLPIYREYIYSVFNVKQLVYLPGQKAFPAGMPVRLPLRGKHHERGWDNLDALQRFLKTLVRVSLCLGIPLP